MNKTRLLEIISAHPWQTRIALTKICSSEIRGVDTADHGSFIGNLLNELREQGQVITTGKARGTRYAAAGSAAYEEPQASDDDRASVLAAVNAGATTTAEVADASGVDTDTARQLLRVLIEVGEIEKTGATKSTRYWPKGAAPEKSVKPAVAETSVKRAPPRDIVSRDFVTPVAAVRAKELRIEIPDLTPAEPEPIGDQPKVDPVDALRRTFASLPRRTVSRRAGEEVDTNVYALDEVLHMAEAYGLSRWQASKLIQNRILGKMGEGHGLGGDLVIHAQNRYAHKRAYPGWSVYVWRPAKDDDLRPEIYQPIPKSMPSEAKLAKAEAKSAEKKKKAKR